MKNINARTFNQIYKDLEIDLDNLGCVMIDVEPVKGIEVNEDWLFYSKHQSRFWIDGYVFKNPHLTLLYGLMDSAQDWSKHVEAVLADWKFSEVTVADIGYFDSPYEDEAYYCIVAHIEVTPELMEGHQRLELLPHINTFTGYKPHITLAYVKKDEAIRDNVISMFKNMIGYKLPIKGLNLGK